jgi:hypothetical protein
MISVFKDIPKEFVSIKPFNMSKTWDFTEASVGSGSDSILVFEGKYIHSSSDQVGSGAERYVFDDMGYVVNYNYNLANGDKYMPVSESLNPNGSVKRMMFHAVNNLFYSSSHSPYYEQGIYDLNALSSGSLFLFYIPQKYIAESINPGTFSLIDTSDVNNLPYGYTNIDGINIVDYSDKDRIGRLYDINNTEYTRPIGNISYTTGHIIITDFEYVTYFLNSLITGSVSPVFNIEFTSHYTAYQHEYICAVGYDEFNNSLNPTLYSGDYDFVMPILSGDPTFTTFITTIGLYDASGNLMVIGKLAKPLRKQKIIDSLFVVKFDI